MDPTVRHHGLGDSPVTAASIAVTRRLNDVQWDTDGCSLVWLEGRGFRKSETIAHFYREVDAFFCAVTSSSV